MLRLIFLGPPGAGKGTQAATLAESWEIPHISTGDLLRQAVAEQNILGKQASSFMDKGELVPDSLVIELIRERLSQVDCHKGWILDGFPRSISQAQSLEELLQSIQQTYDFIIYFQVETEALVKRMLGRGRQDDNEVTIRRRLEVYREQTLPLIDFYRQGGCLKTVDGNGSVTDITNTLFKLMSSSES